MKIIHKVEFVSLFYSIPIVLTYNLLKAKLEGILVNILSAMKYNNPREKLLTGPVLFICAMYISNTLIGTSASRWYCCRFAVCRGTLLGLHKPTDTEPLIHRLAMNQLESTDGLDFFAKISFMKRKKHNLLLLPAREYNSKSCSAKKCVHGINFLGKTNCWCHKCRTFIDKLCTRLKSSVTETYPVQVTYGAIFV